jgi:hypothetical protein
MADDFYGRDAREAHEREIERMMPLVRSDFRKWYKEGEWLRQTESGRRASDAMAVDLAEQVIPGGTN